MTATKKYYAGIGSRETPVPIQTLMHKIAIGLDKRRYTLRSGGAKGADLAFESGVMYGKSEIFTPYGFIPEWTEVFTEMFHPAPHNLTNYARRLMNRNAMQILGADGDTPVDFVICWTKDGGASGGTGQAIRIAEFYNITVFNLNRDGDYEKLKEFVNGNSK